VADLELLADGMAADFTAFRAAASPAGRAVDDAQRAVGSGTSSMPWPVPQ
jgi:hypothetical protein